VVDDLRGKLSLLETQYGILSVDDITLIQASLIDIDELEMLVDLNDAVDELIEQP